MKETNFTSDNSNVQPIPDVQRADTKPFTMSFYGNSSIKIKSKSGKVIYIDPWLCSEGYNEEADYILVTHDHYDHQPNEKIKGKPNCIMITWKEALLDGNYIKCDYGDIQIEAVAAGGNEGHDIKSCVGYLVTVDGVTIYHSGDTCKIDEMNKLVDRKIDYALYPVDGIFTMSAEEATECANLVGATHNIPVHAANSEDTHREDQFTAKGKLEMAAGDTISLASN